VTITLVFVAGIMVTVIGWLFRQTINTQPWIATAEDNAVSGTSLNTNSKTIGLATFLAVATSLFALFVSAYSLRMQMQDWIPLVEPDLLWINTGVLVVASIVLQWTRGAAIKGKNSATRIGLTLASVLTILFLFGQLLAWQKLQAAGFTMSRNPSNAFFYLLTGIHGAHMLGGLWVCAKATIKVWTGADANSIRVSVELCTIYWHFLLLVWAVLFGMFLST
jgi:cytochrome c oxidase subunit 3